MERIGRYRLTARIGAGSFATVYKGHDDELDVPVAVKVLNPKWANNADVETRFLTEARLLRRIKDEHIVRVYDIGRAPDGAPYFVMDYADGGSFDRLRKNPIAPGRALRLCADAARALDVLHRHNVIHRDVTPGNILLTHSTSGLKVLLADLGVAESLVTHTGEQVTAGTPAFMALEQATGQPLDHRSDIYSMAAVTYAVLGGNPPFPIRTLGDLLSRNPNVDPPPLSARLGAPVELDALLASALSPHPDRRPQSAAHLAASLDALAEVMPGGEVGPRPAVLHPMSSVSPGSLIGAVPVAPAPPATGVPDRPTAPMPSSGYESWTPTSMGSFGNETPASMLENYLGKGRYVPEQVKERHSAMFYVYVGLSVVVTFALVMWLTVTYLT
ncbi:serine/threonine-protein kinase [Propionibacteriaceae bacterium G1746]|uniref:serine/threonine-protein kinase n=1 Tax=Aestuariimicrobium sp. G57 TaxID=3418485 RepID=UPI003C26E3E2